MRLLFYPAAAIALVCQLAVAWSVVVGRAPASSGGRRARWAEIGWVVLPTVVLILVLMATWRAIDAVSSVSHLTGVTA